MLRKMRDAGLLALAILLLCSTASAKDIAYCASDGYDSACSECSFDERGNINSFCNNIYMGIAKACVAWEYKSMVAAWRSKNCPALQACIDKLQACSADTGRCPGKAVQDCKNPACKSCYVEADRCAYVADSNCQCGDGICDDETEECESCAADCRCGENQKCENAGCVDLEEGEERPTTTTTLSGKEKETARAWELLGGLLGFLDDLGCVSIITLPITALAAALARQLPT